MGDGLVAADSSEYAAVVLTLNTGDPSQDLVLLICAHSSGIACGRGAQAASDWNPISQLAKKQHVFIALYWHNLCFINFTKLMPTLVSTSR